VISGKCSGLASSAARKLKLKEYEKMFYYTKQQHVAITAVK
jgi:hypothetical protein